MADPFTSYQHSTGEIEGSTGAVVARYGGLAACARSSKGVYLIDLSPEANSFEHVIGVNILSDHASNYTYAAAWLSDAQIRVRTMSFGEPADVDFSIEVNRYRTGDPEIIPTPAPAPGLGPIFDQNVALLELQNLVERMGDALDGQMILVLDPSTADITAAELNAGDAFTVTRTIRCVFALPSLLGAIAVLPHTWSNASPVLTPGGVVADPDIGPLIAVGTKAFARGVLDLTVVFDTDAGATKTWAPGDTQTMTIDLSTVSPLFTAIAPVTFTWTVT